MVNGIDRGFHDNRWWVSVQGHSVMIWREWSSSDTSQLKLDVLSRLNYVDGPGTQVLVLRHCCAIDVKNGSPTTTHRHIEIVDPYDAYNTKHLQISTLSSLINRWHFITDQHLALWRSSIVRIGSCTDSPTLQCYVHCTWHGYSLQTLLSRPIGSSHDGEHDVWYRSRPQVQWALLLLWGA